MVSKHPGRADALHFLVSSIDKRDKNVQASAVFPKKTNRERRTIDASIFVFFAMTRTALFRACSIAALSLGLSFAASAKEAEPAAAAAAPTAQSLAKTYPGLTVSEIRPVGSSGLYELRIGKSDLLYTNAQGTHLIRGEVIEAGGRNLTAERVAELSAIDYKLLDMRDAFKVVKGDGKRQIATFEDPNCGFCKKLTKAIDEIDNVTVHVFLYPILGKDSEEKSRNIWCAKDSGAAYMDWMTKGVVPPKAECDTSAIERNKQFGREHSIRGTPAIIFPDGRTHPGALDAKRLDAMLR